MVDERFSSEVAWRGSVHVFDLTGHATATRAFAWSDPTANGPRFTSVLAVHPVMDAVDAVRAAIGVR